MMMMMMILLILYVIINYKKYRIYKKYNILIENHNIIINNILDTKYSNNLLIRNYPVNYPVNIEYLIKRIFNIENI